MVELAWLLGVVFILLSTLYFLDLNALSFIPYENAIMVGVLSFVGSIYVFIKWIDELTENSLWGPFTIFGTIDLVLAVVLLLQGLLNIGAKYVSFLTKYVPQGTLVYYIIFAIAGIDFIIGPLFGLQS